MQARALWFGVATRRVLLLLRIEQGWMARTALVSATKPVRRIPSAAGGDVREALLTLNTLVVAPENRCSPYDSDSYPYSQSVEPQIVARMGGRVMAHIQERLFTTPANGHRAYCGKVRSARQRIMQHERADTPDFRRRSIKSHAGVAQRQPASKERKGLCRMDSRLEQMLVRGHDNQGEAQVQINGRQS